MEPTSLSISRRRSARRLAAVGLVAAIVSPSTSSPLGHTFTPVRQVSNRLDVMIIAHADDWQVFLGDVVVERIKAGRHPVFIYLTAGDHGRDPAYWQQREAAALLSTGIAVGGVPASASKCSSIQVGAHSIHRCALGPSESFFLRRPDGNRNGSGFARNHFESLRKLRSNRVGVIHTIDSSGVYSNWQDLTATLASLVRMAADSMHATEIVLHTTDPSVRINPHDHYDHRMAGKLTETMLKSNDWSGRYYIGYALATRAPNRTTLQRQEKLEVFSAYDRAMIQANPKWSAYREHPGFYAECMERTYTRSFKRASLTARTH